MPPQEIDRTDRILAFIMLGFMSDATQQQKIERLSQVGFTNAEIADLLETSRGSVNQALYAARSARDDKDKKKQKKKAVVKKESSSKSASNQPGGKSPR